jgi:ribosomal protein L7/L12
MSGLSSEQEGQIRELLAQNQKIAAVKLYRELTGAGLKEAKDAVEAIERGEPVREAVSLHFDTQNNALLEENIKQLLLRRQKIHAVKLYREAHNCGLKEAKDAVDAIEMQMRTGDYSSRPPNPAISNDPFAEDSQRNRGFLAFLIAIFLLVIGGVAFFLLTGNGF